MPTLGALLTIRGLRLARRRHCGAARWSSPFAIVGEIPNLQASTPRRAFLERYCDTSTLCCTMHFPSPSVGYIKRWGAGFRCEPTVD